MVGNYDYFIENCMMAEILDEKNEIKKDRKIYIKLLGMYI